MLLCTMRGRCKAPGLRLTDHPSGTNAPFAFTPPLGLVRPMARTHVRLLGPCFKTGRRDRRPTRDRDADRVSEHACYTSRLKYPSAAETGAQGLPAQVPTNFTRVLVPQPTVRRAKCRRSATFGPSRRQRDVLSDRTHRRRQTASLNLRHPLRESLRLPLHSFTYF